jgi:type IV pilus assembly protein PilA
MKNIQQGLTMVDRMVMIAFIGILAAVAIPAYGDYTVHAKAAQASIQLEGLNMSPTQHYISLTTGVF